MRRLAAQILVAAFLALGSGTLLHLHALQHQRNDAVQDADHKHHSSHDENTCQYHALLRAPVISSGWAPVLALVGVLIALLREVRPLAIGRFALVPIDCRGPPAL